MLDTLSASESNDSLQGVIDSLELGGTAGEPLPPFSPLPLQLGQRSYVCHHDVEISLFVWLRGTSNRMAVHNATAKRITILKQQRNKIVTRFTGSDRLKIIDLKNPPTSYSYSSANQVMTSHLADKCFALRVYVASLLARVSTTSARTLRTFGLSKHRLIIQLRSERFDACLFEINPTVHWMERSSRSWIALRRDSDCIACLHSPTCCSDD